MNSDFHHHYRIHQCLIAASIILAGCNQAPTSPEVAGLSQQIAEANNNMDVLSKPGVFIYLQANNLVAIDPDTQQNYPLKRLASEHVPPTQTLNTFKLSPNQQYIVWYTASAGLLYFDTGNQTIHTPEQASTWLNSDSQIVEFHPTKDATILYARSPYEFVSLDLVTQEKRVIVIDATSGPAFVPSPHGTTIALIQGFNQVQEYARYTIVELTSGDISSIYTSTTPQDRYQIAWSHDDQHLLTLEDGRIVAYALKDGNKKEFAKVANEAVSKLIQYQSQVVAVTTANNIYMVNANNGNHVQIDSQNINLANINVLSDHIVAGVEEVSDTDIITSRLWLVSTNTAPRLLLPEYMQQAKLKFPESNESQLTY